MNPPENNYWSYAMKSLGLFILGGFVGYFAGSTIEFFKNFDKNYKFEDVGDFPNQPED